MSEESETNAEDATPAFFEDADAPDQEKEEFRRLDARERPTASQEGSPDTTAAANASIHRGSRYEGGTDELTSDIGAGPTDPLASDIDVPVNSSDRPDVDITPTARNRQSRPVDGDPVASSEDGTGAATETTLDRSDLPAPAEASVGATAPASRESAATASAADENQTEQQAPGAPVAAPQSAPNAAADDDAESAPTAQAPAVVFSGTTGNEDEAIAIDLGVTLTDTDGNETLSITISGVPEGAQLSGGTDNGDGTWLLEPSDLAGLTITPPENFSGSISLAVTATATETTGQTAVTTATADITVQAVADAPGLKTTDEIGAEDTSIALDIQSSLLDTDGSETLSVRIRNIPNGSQLTLADGTEVTITGGTATLTPDQLEGLSLTPPADFSGEIALDIVATSTDGSDTATTSGTLNVGVTAVADAPVLTISDATGLEDQAIALNIDAALTDSGETLSVSISNIPEGAVLTLADGTVIPVTGGTTALTPDQLDGLSLTPPADFSGEIALNVTATSTDGTDTDTTSSTLNISVTAVADAPTLDLTDATGSEDQAIALNIDAALTDAGETLGVSIGNIPEGAVLTLADGTVIPVTGGTAALTPDQLAGLSLTPPANFSGDIALEVVATSTDGTDTTTTSGTLNVGVTAVADAPTLDLTDATGSEDQAIALDIDSSLVDGGEVLSISIGDIPEGSILAAGDGTVIPIEAGVAVLSPDQLTGLILTPPTDFSGEIALDIVATSTDGTDTATTSGTLNISVTAVADAPVLNASDAAGLEDQAIALNIDAALTDTDGSETLSVSIGNIPEGAVLTLADGTVIPVTGGTATLTPDQLAGLSLTPPADFSGEIALEVVATSTDGTDTATTSGTLNVGVTAVADAPTLELTDANGLEDQAIALDIDAALTDAGETLSVTIGNIPEGSVLALADGTEITITDGTAELTPDQLAGLTITPPHDSDADFNLSVTTVSHDGTSTAMTSASIHVAVQGVADAPPLAITVGAGTVSAVEIPPQSITIGQDNVTTSDSGFTVTARTLNSDGSLSEPSSDNISLNSRPVGFGVKGSASGADTELGFNSSTGTSEELTIAFDDAVTGADVSLAWANGAEQAHYEVYRDGEKVGEGTIQGVTDGIDPPVAISATDGGTFDAIVFSSPGHDHDYLINEVNFETAPGSYEIIDYPLTIATGLTDTDGSEQLSVTVSGLPDGAVLSTGTANTDGSVTLTADELNGLVLTAPAGTGNILLSVTSTATESNGTSASISTQVSIDVAEPTMDGVADAPTLGVSDALGSEDSAITLDIQAALTDTDGSESLSVSVSGIPDGAVLSLADGTVIPVNGGTAALNPDQLNGVKLTPPEDFSGSFDLQVAATSTEGSETSTVTGVLNVSVSPVVDTPMLSVALGEPTVATVGGTAVPTSITLDNYAALDAGYQVTARSINLDGSLTEAHAGNVSTGNGGIGVRGLASGNDYEIGHSLVHDVSEQLVVDFDSAITEASVSFAQASPLLKFFGGGKEQGHYDLYRDGEKVGEGDFASSSWGGDGTFTAATIDESGFDQIVFSAAKGYAGNEAVTVGDGSDFIITQIDFTAKVGGDPVATYPLDIQAALTDTDGSESLAITIAGVPADAALSAGTNNGDGSWTLDPDQLAGLNLTIPGTLDTAFQLDITAQSTESDGTTAMATTNVTVTPDGPQNAPEVSLGTTEFTQDFPIQPISFAADAVLSDLDGSEISQAVIAISDGYNLGDILSVEDNTIIDDLTGKTMISGTNIEVVGGGFDLTSNALTLQGTDSVEAYQSVINSLTFNSLSPELIEGTRTVSITVMDDTGLVSQTADLGITLNDPLATDLFADGGTATTDPALAALSDPALAETTDPNTDWLTATESEPVSAFDDPAAETALPDVDGADSGLSSDPAISDAQDLTTI
ncbi:MAG: tandem-95 repeat protein [Rhodospirillales bacterium]